YFGNKGTFRKNKNGIARAENVFDGLRGFAPRSCFCAIERKVAHLAEKGADERHAVNFVFCHETIRHAEAKHEWKHVEVAGVIRNVNLGAGRVHEFLADHANLAASNREESFQRSRGVPAGGAIIFEEKDDSPTRNEPRDEQTEEVQAANRVPHATKTGGDTAARGESRARSAKACDLQPRGRFLRQEPARNIELFGFFWAQFSAGSFRNAPRRDEFNAIWRRAEARRNLFSHGGGDFRTSLGTGFTRLGDDNQFFGAG